jgi:hypothetical protein
LTARELAIAELTLTELRHQAHARAAMAALRRAKPGDRDRRAGRGGRATSREWRRAKRHMRLALKARETRVRLLGGAL